MDNSLPAAHLGGESSRLEQYAEQQLAGAQPHILLERPLVQQPARKLRVPKAQWHSIAVGGSVADYSAVGQGIRHPYFRCVAIAGPCQRWQNTMALRGSEKHGEACLKQINESE